MSSVIWGGAAAPGAVSPIKRASMGTPTRTPRLDSRPAAWLLLLLVVSAEGISTHREIEALTSCRVLGVELVMSTTLAGSQSSSCVEACE